MKKYLLFIISFAFFLVSCDDDTDPGNTATEKMSGDWWVTVDVITPDGTNHGDAYGLGHILMYTYNTAANIPTEVWLEDAGHFWDYKVKVNIDYTKKTFTTSDFVENIAYESKVNIIDGKVLEGTAKTPSGMPADSIVYKVQFDDDDDGYTYQVSGFRRTGFPADDF